MLCAKQSHPDITGTKAGRDYFAQNVKMRTVCSDASTGDLTVSLSDGLTTLEGIHFQLTPASLVCPNVQISGIDPSNINNITLQVITHLHLSLYLCLT